MINPQINPMPIGTAKATGNTFHGDASGGMYCKTRAPVNADSAMIEPTEMSIPPEIITIVMPTAMIA